jgi:hypothetical protein
MEPPKSELKDWRPNFRRRNLEAGELGFIISAYFLTIRIACIEAMLAFGPLNFLWAVFPEFSCTAVEI